MHVILPSNVLWLLLGHGEAFLFQSFSIFLVYSKSSGGMCLKGAPAWTCFLQLYVNFSIHSVSVWVLLYSVSPKFSLFFFFLFLCCFILLMQSYVKTAALFTFLLLSLESELFWISTNNRYCLLFILLHYPVILCHFVPFIFNTFKYFNYLFNGTSEALHHKLILQ